METYSRYDSYLASRIPLNCQAQQLLGKIVRRNRRDVAARLMLATLLRRIGRSDDAAKELKKLATLEAAGPWKLEIGHELEALRRIQSAGQPDASPFEETPSGESDQGPSAGVSQAA